MATNSQGGWIGVDLDGTLAVYDGWKGPTHIGSPVTAMVERVKRWLSEGWEVRVFTARISGGSPEGDLAYHAIRAWTLEHIGVSLPVTNVKDFAMVELWDDRAVQVIPNTGQPVGASTRGLT